MEWYWGRPQVGTGAVGRRPFIDVTAGSENTGVCSTIVCMEVDRFSITMEPKLGQAVREVARQNGMSVSAWISEAVADRVRNELLGVALDEWEAEFGAPTEEGLKRAAREMGIPWHPEDWEQ